MRFNTLKKAPIIQMYKLLDFESAIREIETSFEDNIKKKVNEIKARALAQGAAKLGKDGETLKFDEPFASEMALARFEHSRNKTALRERLVAIEAEFQLEMNKIEKEFSSRINKRYSDLLKGK